MSLPSAVLQALGDPVIVLDRGGEVIVWTPAAERLLGLAASEVLGRGLPDIGIRLDTLMAGRERRLTLKCRGGPSFPATVIATLLLGDDGERQGVVLLVKDLRPWIGPASAEPPAGAGPNVEERLGAAFRGIVEAAGMDLELGGNVEGTAQSLVEQGRRLLPGISCLIATVPAARQDVFYCLAGAGPLAETIAGQSYPLQSTVLGAALAEDRPIERTDMQTASGFPQLLVTAGINTMRAIPMSTRQPLPDGRRTLGAVAFYRSVARPFTAAERRLLDDFAALISLSLQQAELRAATERTMGRLQLAVDVALDLARSLDVSEVVRRLVRRAAVATNADRCALLRLEGGEDGEAVTVDAYDRTGYSGVGHRLPLSSQPQLVEAVSSRAPVLGGPPETGAMPPERRRALRDIRHMATIPLVYGGEVIAVLVLSRRRDHIFGPEEVDTLMLLGGPAALALRNSFLYARTEEASRVKSDFLDMAAHELRTPLTVISGYLSILREGAFGPAPAAWSNPLRILDSKATELRRLVDDLLLAARLETGRLETAPVPVDLREAVEQLATAAEPAPLVVVPEDAVMVAADRDQLLRMVDHLVSNAMVYGRAGAPSWVRVSVEVEPEQGWARLAVEDRGRGLPMGATDRIFDRFTRLEDPDHPMVPGTGLGLYITRELAARHQGRVELEWSQPGVGSRFALYLPLLEGPTEPEPDDGEEELAPES